MQMRLTYYQLIEFCSVEKVSFGKDLSDIRNRSFSTNTLIFTNDVTMYLQISHTEIYDLRYQEVLGNQRQRG